MGIYVGDNVMLHCGDPIQYTSINTCLLYTSIKMKITDLDKMKIEEQKKAVRSGYDMEIIPSDLATYGGEAKRLLQDLQTRNERMFLVTILIMNTAASRQKLENAIFQTASIARNTAPRRSEKAPAS